MKHHLLLFIMVFLFPFMACGDDELKEIYNPNLLRSTSIDDSSLHLAFPTLRGIRIEVRLSWFIEKVRATLVLIVS